MFAVSPTPTGTPVLEDLAAQARALLEGERDATANAANISALLFNTLPDLNWAGFYWMKGGGLVLAPSRASPPA